MSTLSHATLPNAELNVTPMLDVLLVLLIIFMAMAIRFRPTIDTNLPQACSGSCDGTPTIVLEVLPGPAYRLNRRPIAGAELASRLREVFAPRPDKIIQVAGHPTASYQDVVTAMDIARGAGVTVIGIAPRASYLRP